MYAAKAPQKINTARKADKKEKYLFCGIRKEGIIPAIEIDHHGKIRPIEKANSPVANKEAINFFIYFVSLI